MKPPICNYIHEVKISRRLFEPNGIPFVVTKEVIPENTPGSWCRHKDSYELIVYAQGEGYFCNSKECLRMFPGTTCLIPPDTVTCHYHEGTIHYYNLIFRLDRLNAGGFNFSESPLAKKFFTFVGEGEDRHSPVHYLEQSFLSSLVNKLEKIIWEYIQARPGSQEIFISDFLSIISQIFRHASIISPEENLDQRKIASIATYIENNCRQRFSLREIAREFCMSESSLCHKFKKIMGIPPIEHVIRCRLRNAIFLLTFRDDIVTLAAECGFQDSNYFSRIFHARFGLTPLQFKTLYRKGDLNPTEIVNKLK